MQEKLIWVYAAIWTAAAVVLMVILWSPYNLWNPIWLDPAAEDMSPVKYHDMFYGTVIEAVKLGALIATPWVFLFLRKRPFLRAMLLRYAVFLWTMGVVIWQAVSAYSIYSFWNSGDEYARFRPAYAQPVAAEHVAEVSLWILTTCVYLVPALAYWLYTQRDRTKGLV